MYESARQMGILLASKEYTVICGGLGGVMEGVCRGAKEAGGTTIGVLPTDNSNDANEYVDYKIVTGLGIGRNIVIIKSAEAIIAINGSFGTLSELGFALQLNKPVIGLKTWDVSKKIIAVDSPEEAIEKQESILKKK